ncbi:MAG: hypothetical protein KAR06_04490 [Deltaproteobacteria bacterium]|nr:hypothetical protein [Deltaproteobacteria bacterium]
MKMTEEIDEIPEGFMEVPANGPIKPKKFGSGHDWIINDFVAEREILISRAKDGSFGAKRALMSEPHNIRALVLGGKEII